MARLNLNLGTLVGTIGNLSEVVSPTEPDDIYRFSIPTASITSPVNFNAALRGMTGDADLEIYLDRNNNGIVDSSDLLLINSSSPGNADEAVNLRLTTPGNYIARVRQFNSTSTAYTLSLSNTGTNPSNLLPTETNVANLGLTPYAQFNSLANDNTANTYRFTMATAGNFNAALTNVMAGANVDMRLIRDANNNGIIDAGDVIVSSNNASNASETINVRSLATGTYFLQTHLTGGSPSIYRLAMSNTGAISSNLITPEVEAGTLSSNPFVRSSSVTTNNAANTYRFTMGSTGNFNASLSNITAGANVDMRLIRDANNNGVVDPGEVIVGSFTPGNSDEAINIRSLAAGNYILQTSSTSGAVGNYTLRMSNTGSSAASNLLPTEFNVGALSSTPFSRSSSVTTNNAANTYRFTMGSTGNFNASLTNMTAGADVDMRLVRDVNNNGVIDAGDVVVSSERAGSADESINVRSLAAGSYILQTSLFRGGTMTGGVVGGNYNLKMSNTGGASSNLVPTEVQAGTLGNTPFARSSSVSVNNAANTYRFTMGSTGNFNASLTNMTAGADVDMRLVRDVNNNGVIDSGDVVVRSERAGNADESINVRSLTAGSYILQTSLFSGSSGSYNLKMSNTAANPSNLLPIETTVGTIPPGTSRSGSLGNTNAADTFRFSIASTRSVKLGLSGLTANADLRLIQDINNNGVIDAGEEFARSASAGTATEQIIRTLNPGNYIAQVYLPSSGSTSYTLSLA